MVMFMAAATGERDPRCLLRVFRMFPTVVRNLTLGTLSILLAKAAISRPLCGGHVRDGGVLLPHRVPAGK